MHVEVQCSAATKVKVTLNTEDTFKDSDRQTSGLEAKHLQQREDLCDGSMVRLEIKKVCGTFKVKKKI